MKITSIIQCYNARLWTRMPAAVMAVAAAVAAAAAVTDVARPLG